MIIPITFEYHGKIYSGTLSQVSGSGSTALFHLIIKRKYYGQLWLTEHFGWRWSSNTFQEFEVLIDEFERVIVAAYS